MDELGFYSFRRARISGRWSGTHRQLPAYAVGDGEVLVWFSIDWVSFTSKLVSSRVTSTMTPLMFVSALLQYNSGNSSLGTNVRLRWE